MPEVRATTVRDDHDLAGHEPAGSSSLALFLKAYSLGGGTYTGIEAVSNNVNMLKAAARPHRQVDDVPDGRCR